MPAFQTRYVPGLAVLEWKSAAAVARWQTSAKYAGAFHGDLLEGDSATQTRCSRRAAAQGRIMGNEGIRPRPLAYRCRVPSDAAPFRATSPRAFRMHDIER